MQWTDKRPRSADANIKKSGTRYEVRVKLLLPNRSLFERQHFAATKTAARKIRDDLYAAFNALAFEILAECESPKPVLDRLTLKELAERCRDEWWPARGRSPDICEQFFQKLRDYCFPILGEDRPIDTLCCDDWDRVLTFAKTQSSQFKRPLSESTLRKIKAVLSSALTCAVSRKYLAQNPIKGLSFSPHPLSEADRVGVEAGDPNAEDLPAKRPLQVEEAKQILDAARGKSIYPLVVLQLVFGLRIAEALAVRWSDFDEGRRVLRVRYQVKRRRNPEWKAGSKTPKSMLQRVAVLKSKAGRRDILVFGEAQALLKSLSEVSPDALVCPSEAGGHIARLINFDEPPREPSYVGFNGEAVRYWREKMKHQPVTPGLRYPTLPESLTHGKAIVEEANLFQVRRGSAPDAGGFRVVPRRY